MQSLLGVLILKLQILKEEYDWENYLKHLKHLEEYKDDDRLKSIVSILEGQLIAFKRKWDLIADGLAKSEAGKAFSDDTVIGYIRLDGRFVKYNKDTNDFVVYVMKGNPKNPRYVTISMHKKSLDEYNKIAKRDFYKELPENQSDEQPDKQL